MTLSAFLPSCAPVLLRFSDGIVHAEINTEPQTDAFQIGAGPMLFRSNSHLEQSQGVFIRHRESLT